jgi:hypothetical protein
VLEFEIEPKPNNKPAGSGDAMCPK